MFLLVVFSYLCSLGCCLENFTVIRRFAVPQNHHVCLTCSGSARSDVVWTHGDSEVLLTWHGEDEDQRHLQLSDGVLCVLQILDSDGGRYECDRKPVAELQVFTGLDVVVSAGWTLLLPCKGSSRPKQRWFVLRQSGGRRESIFTRFRNGTARPERDQDQTRLSYQNDALQIQDLQPDDAGVYECNRELQARVRVLVETSSIRPSCTSSDPRPGPTRTSAVEPKKTRMESVLLMVAVSGLVLMILVLTLVWVLLIGLSFRRARRTRRARSSGRRQEGAELQPWITPARTSEWEGSEWAESDRLASLSGDSVHYAELGCHNRRTLDQNQAQVQDQNRDHVIYSAVKV